jgi:hypothetical protein
MMPSDFYSRKPGEKIVLRAFMEKEMEERKEAIDTLSNIG